MSLTAKLFGRPSQTESAAPAPGRRPSYLIGDPARSPSTTTFVLPREHVKLPRKEKESPYARLYMQGVHLLDHKDHVHKMFGLTKTKESPRTPTRSGSRPASAQSGRRESTKMTMSQGRGKDPSVRSTIRKIRRSLTSEDNVLVHVSRKCAPALDKHSGEKRPGVAPLRTPRQSPRTSPGRGKDVAFDDNGDGHFLFPTPKTVAVNSAEADDSKVRQLMEQIDLLKSSLGLSDEDLQWKLESSKTNGFEVADRHLTTAEADYDRLLYEQSLLHNSPTEDMCWIAGLQSCRAGHVAAGLHEHTKDIATFKAQLTKAQESLRELKVKVEDPKLVADIKAPLTASPTRRGSMAMLQVQSMDSLRKDVLSIQEQFKQAVLKQNVAQTLIVATTETMLEKLQTLVAKFATEDLLAAAKELLKTVHEVAQATGETLLALVERAIVLCQSFKGYRARELQIKDRQINATLKQMEIWRSRRENAKEYSGEMKRLEEAWRANHSADNQVCLERLCSLIPDSIAAMSVDQLLDAAKQAGVLYTRDLVNYLKQNKLLQWVVTHEVDKARDNFISGDTAQCFTNLELYDITEMRAIYLALPDAFEFDKEGRKAEWRVGFIAHLKVLVQQYHGETVKAGWDPVKGARAEVKLKPLSDKQLLNPVYRYPTEDEIKQRLVKFETQAKRLAQKKARLQALVEHEIPLAKKEYHAVSDDCRSDDLIKSFGKPTLIRLRDEAKKIFQSLCKERDGLKSEIIIAERAIQVACPTHEQYLDEIAAIRLLPPDIRHGVIRGPFAPTPDIKPKERAVHKKLSAEEEALARKHELSNAIAERSKEFPRAEEAAAPVPKEVMPKRTPKEACVKAVHDVMSQIRTVSAVKASPNVLHFLQTDFCARKSTTELVRSESTRTLPDEEMSSAESGDSVPAKAASQPKSHALLKMLGLATTPSLLKKRPSIIEPTLLDDIAKPNNLAEIQRRRTSRSPCASPLLKTKPLCVMSSTAEEGARPNFLDELKRRANKAEPTPPSVLAAAPSPTKMSFLDELKAKRGKREDA
ncbi:hypothetical protein SPRG_08869 [Saprolegnia parasitica CBS 223.65]|uniref:Uncharacterized protein n=1 Tax=Saprolegnia parasitica (strain CBS 223.65) TaxID=695850 RepID=A0A067C5X9_SAPPC|nr:hypothetical protein SPRG_08869 [Saprolegnia parasitica CBS 223.65]KDO25928.1 hypothetical protein SPRG_08869 [Saprolegnia parasitica CBS 223.65]|eukprot:XP_012203486.1 hypothetical protein SPRG_08869 [Saprolegnia parasitica CBS 223.65]